MPDETKPRFSKRLPVFLVLVLLPCLLSNSCASSRPARSAYAAKSLSANADSAYRFLVYQDLMRQGKKDEATAELEALVKKYPSPELAVELANLQWGQNQREKATATLEAATAAFPASRQLTLYLANAYQMRRMGDKAVATLGKFLAAHPSDAAARRELASLLEDAGKHKEALQVLSRIPEADRDAATCYLMAKAMAGLGQNAKAVALLRQAVDKDQTLLPAWLDLGGLLESQGDLAGAEDAYRKMLSQDAGSPEVQARLLRILLKRKKPDQAMKLLRDETPDKPHLLDAMSAFVEAGYPKQARQALDMLVAADPASPDLPFYKAVLAYEGDKNPKKALEILAEVAPDNPNYDKSLSFRIQIATELGDYAKAEGLVREARTRYPDRKEFIAVEAALLDKRGDTAQAATVLEKALAASPDDLDLLYRYGVALEKLKRRSEAKAVMEKIVAKDPVNPDALNYLGYSLAEEGRDLDKAIDMIRLALSKEPDNPFFLDSLAWAQFKLGRTEEALATIRSAAVPRVKDAIVWEHYGDIAAASGHKAEAQKAYRTALELGSDNPKDVKKKLGAL
ncbi:MAG: tetratricopeptide repeat protein [Desulfovibrio sp.]